MTEESREVILVQIQRAGRVGECTLMHRKRLHPGQATTPHNGIL